METGLKKRGDFLPPAYQVPDKAKQFMKLKPGDNVIRILSAPLLGWVIFTEEKKPVRRHIEEGEFTSEDMIDLKAKRNDKGEFEGAKHFWVLLVWSYAENAPKILEITQVSVLKPLYQLTEDEDWGDLRDFDINVNRVGTGMTDTEFSVTPKPHKPLLAEIEAVLQDLEEKELLDLEAIWKCEYPFEIYNY